MTPSEIKKVTSAQKATRRLVELFNDRVFYVELHSSNTTNTGMISRYRVLCVNANTNVPCIADVTKYVALATGSRYSEKTQTLNLPGYSYSAKDHLKDLLADLALKHEKCVNFCN